MATAGALKSSWTKIARRSLPAVVLLAVPAHAAPAAAAGAASGPQAIAPLPSSQYRVQSACAPALAGRVSCQALELLPLSREARAHRHPLGLVHAAPRGEPSPAEGDYGLTPADLHSAYGLPSTAPSTQTIALVDAYNDPAAQADLNTYDSEFGLPACNAANGCFRQVNQQGQKTGLPFPQTVAELKSDRSGERAGEDEEATEWGIEMSLDIEAAHAVCESCRLLLVEAAQPYGGDLEEAEHSAEALGADEISNSWAGPEQGESEKADEESPFDHPQTVITAAAGDSGYHPGTTEYPASSPHVVAVGGTRLALASGGAWSGESVWNGDGAGGGGCSSVFAAPAWQQSLSDWAAVGCAGKRAVADVAADADPYTGLAVEDSTSPVCEFDYSGHVQHWCTIGGTSLASPLIAAVFALAGGSGGVSYPASTLYANALSSPGSLHDVTEGSNGACGEAFNESTGLSGCTASQEATACSAQAICLARASYDGPTGLGTPDGIAAFQAPAAPEGAEEESSGEEGGGASGDPGEPESGESDEPAEAGESSEAEAGEGPSGAGGGGSTGGPSNPVESEPTEVTEEEFLEEAPAAPHRHHAARAGTCVLSALALAPSSAQAARASDARLSQIAFSFQASAASAVQVSLSRHREQHGHARWQALEHARGIQVTRGHDSRSLAAGALGAGTYRLTLKPRHGVAVSLVFEIR